MKAANASSPEIPDYNQLEGTSQKWRDLEGYYTRHGDVRELMEKVDDRITIMNAGDELRLGFAGAARAAARMEARFCDGGRWLDQRWRLQLRLLKHGASAALSRHEELR